MKDWENRGLEGMGGGREAEEERAGGVDRRKSRGYFLMRG